MSDIPLAPVFVVGCPRSGTALLRNLLRSHPHLAFPGESHFIPSFFRRHGDPPDERAARKLATEILNLRWVGDWGLELVPGDFAAERSFSAIVARLYAEVVRMEGKQRWGDKTPQYVLEIPLLLRLFPDARVLHIIRDGRDVALSWLAVNFGPENIYTSALEWRKFVEAGRGAAREFPAAVMELRYENLLARPEETMRAVCAFIGEPFTPAVLSPSTRAYHMREPLIGQRRASYPSDTTLVTTNCDKWRTGMSSRDRVIFETLAGDLLADLGYATEGKRSPLSAPKRAYWRVHHALHWFLARINSRDNARWLLTDLRLRWAALRVRRP